MGISSVSEASHLQKTKEVSISVTYEEVQKKLCYKIIYFVLFLSV